MTAKMRYVFHLMELKLTGVIMTTVKLKSQLLQGQPTNGLGFAGFGYDRAVGATYQSYFSVECNPTLVHTNPWPSDANYWKAF